MEKLTEFHDQIQKLHGEICAFADISIDPSCKELCNMTAEQLEELEDAFEGYISKTHKALAI